MWTNTKWYRAEVVAVDSDKQKVKVHHSVFEGNRDNDEWIGVDDALRLRKRDSQKEARWQSGYLEVG